jgi:hypothetical protein
MADDATNGQAALIVFTLGHDGYANSTSVTVHPSEAEARAIGEAAVKACGKRVKPIAKAQAGAFSSYKEADYFSAVTYTVQRLPT